jgi:hypothetical protein
MPVAAFPVTPDFQAYGKSYNPLPKNLIPGSRTIVPIMINFFRSKSWYIPAA